MSNCELLGEAKQIRGSQQRHPVGKLAGNQLALGTCAGTCRYFQVLGACAGTGDNWGEREENLLEKKETCWRKEKTFCN